MKKIKKIVSETFEIPSEAIGESPFITLSGREKVIIENPKGIAKYEEEILRINTSEGMAEIEGEGIVIKVLSDKCIVAEGKINGIRFM